MALLTEEASSADFPRKYRASLPSSAGNTTQASDFASLAFVVETACPSDVTACVSHEATARRVEGSALPGGVVSGGKVASTGLSCRCATARFAVAAPVAVSAVVDITTTTARSTTTARPDLMVGHGESTRRACPIRRADANVDRSSCVSDRTTGHDRHGHSSVAAPRRPPAEKPPAELQGHRVRHTSRFVPLLLLVPRRETTGNSQPTGSYFQSGSKPRSEHSFGAKIHLPRNRSAPGSVASQATTFPVASAGSLP